MNPMQIVTEALLVVSILDGSMKHASVRRCLRAALSAMDGAQEKGILLQGGSRRIEFASETAERVLRDDLEMPVARLPERIADLHASACRTLVIAGDGSTLVVEATRDGSAMLLSERPSREGMLTARERDVMRCVEDGLSKRRDRARAVDPADDRPQAPRKHLRQAGCSQPNGGVVEAPGVEGQGKLSRGRVASKDTTNVEWIPLLEATRLSSHT